MSADRVRRHVCVTISSLVYVATRLCTCRGCVVDLQTKYYLANKSYRLKNFNFSYKLVLDSKLWFVIYFIQ